MTRHTERLWPLATGLMIGILAMGWLAPHAVGQGGGTTDSEVAVINLDRVLQGSEEWKSTEGRINAERQQVQLEGQRMEQEIQQLRSELSNAALLTPGTEEYIAKQELLNRKQLEFEAWKGYHQGRLNRMTPRELAKFYPKLVATAGEVAREQGFELVIAQEKQAIGDARLDQILPFITNRKVVWSNANLDITDAVIRRMNVGFKKR